MPGKPVGSVHGDSIGVHASDSANAWRNMACVANARNCFASLILESPLHDETARTIEQDGLPVVERIDSSSLRSAGTFRLLKTWHHSSGDENHDDNQ